MAFELEERIYKISLNWNGELYYDGYIVVRKNDEIIGYSDNDGFFYGNVSSKLIEITMGKELPNLTIFEVKDIFSKMEETNEAYTKIIFAPEISNIVLTLELLDPRIPRYSNIKIIEERFNKVLKKFPQGIVEGIRGSYFKEDS